MTTSDLTVKLARAIHRSDEDEMDRLADDFGDLAPHWQRMYLHNAAAVLPIVEAEVRRAQAGALRDAVEKHAITIPDALGYKVPAVTVEDLLDAADQIEKETTR